MKIDFSKRWDDHRWFAWHPVKIDKTDWRWLEMVTRCRFEGAYGNRWLYRA